MAPSLPAWDPLQLLSCLPGSNTCSSEGATVLAQAVCNEHPLLKGFGGHMGVRFPHLWGHILAQRTGLLPWQIKVGTPTCGCWRGGSQSHVPRRLLRVESSEVGGEKGTGVVL